MNPLHKAKQDYENIPIPSDLSALVEDAIEANKKTRFSFKPGWALCCGAAGLIFALNLSPVLAANLQQLPYLGEFFRVLTFRHIETSTELTEINASIPAVTSLENIEMARSINEEIYTLIEGRMDEALERAQTDWQAYLNTGGDPEEKRTTSFWADYEVQCDDDTLLSFIIHIEEASYSVEHLNYYYNLNPHTGQEIQLLELIDTDQIEAINQEIQNQISQREAEDENNLYFHDDYDEFKTICADQHFYITAAHQLVIVFERYEIAPGYMGEQEFLIPFEIVDLR